MSMTTAITTTPVKILDDEWVGALVSNTGSATIYIARTAADCNASAFPMAAGDVLGGEGPLWACTASGTGSAVVLPPTNR